MPGAPSMCWVHCVMPSCIFTTLDPFLLLMRCTRPHALHGSNDHDSSICSLTHALRMSDSECIGEFPVLCGLLASASSLEHTGAAAMTLTSCLKCFKLDFYLSLYVHRMSESECIGEFLVLCGLLASAHTDASLMLQVFALYDFIMRRMSDSECIGEFLVLCGLLASAGSLEHTGAAAMTLDTCKLMKVCVCVCIVHVWF